MSAIYRDTKKLLGVGAAAALVVILINPSGILNSALAQAPNPLPPCSPYSEDSITGTNGDDKLQGGNGRDSMAGLGGNDKMHGGNCDDRMNGGDGNDKLFGGNGNDEMNGGSGNDQFNGGNGNETLTGGPGADHFNCGPGNDDTITDFSPAEGDTKTSNCENF